MRNLLNFLEDTLVKKKYNPFRMKQPQTRTHKERSQPLGRSRFGLLEKHGDYQKRARDYHSKQERLKALRVRATYKNPDEFYFGMINAQVSKRGRHQDDKEGIKGSLPTDTIKLLKTQDVSYVMRQRVLNEKHIERLKQELTLPVQSAHVRFNLEDEKEDKADASTEWKVNEEKIKELRAREERDRQLRIAEADLQAQRNRMGKGAHKKIGEDENGIAIYKWETERKK